MHLSHLPLSQPPSGRQWITNIKKVKIESSMLKPKDKSLNFEVNASDYCLSRNTTSDVFF